MTVELSERPQLKPRSKPPLLVELKDGQTAQRAQLDPEEKANTQKRCKYCCRDEKALVE